MFKKLAPLLLLAPFYSNAVINHSGKVTKLSIEGGIVKFTICSSSCRGYWLAPNSDYNNAMLSVILLAKASKNNVWVQGFDLDKNPSTGWPYGSNSKIATFNVLD